VRNKVVYMVVAWICLGATVQAQEVTTPETPSSVSQDVAEAPALFVITLENLLMGNDWSELYASWMKQAPTNLNRYPIGYSWRFWQWRRIATIESYPWWSLFQSLNGELFEQEPTPPAFLGRACEELTGSVDNNADLVQPCQWLRIWKDPSLANRLRQGQDMLQTMVQIQRKEVLVTQSIILKYLMLDFIYAPTTDPGRVVGLLGLAPGIDIPLTHGRVEGRLPGIMFMGGSGKAGEIGITWGAAIRLKSFILPFPASSARVPSALYFSIIKDISSGADLMGFSLKFSKPSEKAQ